MGDLENLAFLQVLNSKLCTGRRHLLLLEIWKHGLPYWANNFLLFVQSSKERKMPVFIPTVQQIKCSFTSREIPYLSEEGIKLWASRVSCSGPPSAALVKAHLFTANFHWDKEWIMSHTYNWLAIRLQNSWPSVFLAQYFWHMILL